MRAKGVGGASAGKRAPRRDERWLAGVWDKQSFDRRQLRTTSGLAFKVVFPGMCLGGAGPDFRDAILALPDGSLLRGDVELHLESSGWRQHGHHQDPAYDRVLLHVVLEDDEPVRNSQGEPVLTVELAGRLKPRRLTEVPPTNSRRARPELIETAYGEQGAYPRLSVHETPASVSLAVVRPPACARAAPTAHELGASEALSPSARLALGQAPADDLPLASVAPLLDSEVEAQRTPAGTAQSLCPPPARAHLALRATAVAARVGAGQAQGLCELPASPRLALFGPDLDARPSPRQEARASGAGLAQSLCQPPTRAHLALRETAVEVRVTAAGQAQGAAAMSTSARLAVFETAVDVGATPGDQAQGRALAGTRMLPAERAQTQLSYVVAPCQHALPRKEPEVVATLITKLALERFQAKQAVFEGELAVFEPEQVLYAGLLEALGYSRNRAPFRRLAQLAPLPAVVCARTEAGIRELLLESAGLAAGDGARLAVGLPGDTLAAAEWQVVGVRPDNLPSRRIEQFAAVLARLLPSGLLDDLLAPLLEPYAESCAESYADGELGRDEGAGARRLRSAWQEQLADVGRQRADAMAVNVLLPFAAAYGQATCQFMLSEAAVGAFLAYPPQGANQVTSYMRHDILRSQASVAKGAAGEQALLHIWDRWCQRKVCALCPLGRR